MKKKYDIFISYRRDSFHQANLISTRLQALGYRVFIDVEALNSGKFNEQLLSVIKGCKDVLVVLPPNALDRCVDEDDWVRREIICAMDNHKNIIPVMLAGFKWPDPMPKGLEELNMYQAIAPMPDVYFDMQVQKLQGYLKSKAHIKTKRRWITGLSIAAAVIAALLIIGHLTYMPVAQKLSESLLLRTEEMREFDEINDQAYKEWERYVEDYQKQKDPEEQNEVTASFLKSLSKLEKETNTLFNIMKQNKIEVSKFHLPLFWIHGIPFLDLLLIDTYTESCFTDLNNTFEYYRQVIAENCFDRPSINMAKVNSEINHASVEMYYYEYLQMLTHLPKSTHDKFYQLSPEWTNLPQTGLGLSDKEYERLINMTAEKVSNEIKHQRQITAEEDARLSAMEEQLDELIRKGDEIDRILDSIENQND